MTRKSTRFVLVLVLAGLPLPGSEAAAENVVLLSSEGEASRYWPRWRGPSGQGLVEGSGYPDEWSNEKNVLWRAEVPGSGNSSPIVFGDRIFLTTARDEGRRLSLLAYRRSDGELLWDSPIRQSGVERVHEKNAPRRP